MSQDQFYSNSYQRKRGRGRHRRRPRGRGRGYYSNYDQYNYYNHNQPHNQHANQSHYQPYNQFNNYNHYNQYNDQSNQYNQSYNKKTQLQTKLSKSAISAFDVKQFVQNNHPKKPNCNVNLLTYYHTHPSKSLLECNSNIQPFKIKSQIIDLINKNRINLNKIPIDYSSINNNNNNQCVRSLYEQKCPSDILQKSFNRFDPLCYEIQKILKTINSNSNSNVNDDDNKNVDQIVSGINNVSLQTPNVKFITYRHNLRAIASVILYKLKMGKIYDTNGVNIGVHRKDNNIILENIIEDGSSARGCDNQVGETLAVYGHLFEHLLDSLSNTNGICTIPAMDFKKHLVDRDEIRALLNIKMNDVEIITAAEMDGIMVDSNNNVKVIELKCCKIWNRRSNYNRSKIKYISDSKLLKIWTQCYFGGVDQVIIGFHRDGVITKMKSINSGYIEQLFPKITAKCIQMVYSVLKWVQTTVLKLPANRLYVLSFDTKSNNSDFVLNKLPSTTMGKKILKLLNATDDNKKDKQLNQGLVIHSQNGVIELKSI